MTFGRSEHGTNEAKKRRSPLGRRNWLASVSVLVLAGLAFQRPAIAEDWVGGVSSDWGDAGNWLLVVPDQDEQVDISGGAANAPKITSTAETSALYMGRAGGDGASLQIEGGGTLKSTAAYIGNEFSADATVTGAGSSWTTANEMYVGFEGRGGLAVTDHSAVSVGSGLYLGVLGTSSGAIDVGSGGSLSVHSGAYVGINGTGTINVTGGGYFASLGSIFNAGVNGGAQGSVLVDGAGSRWDATGLIQIGVEGKGNVTISNGAHFEQEVAGFAGGLAIGTDPGGSGTVTVSGAGSRADLAEGVTVGIYGQGALYIHDGAAVGSGEAQVGINALGTVNLAGGATWDTRAGSNPGDGGLHVGITSDGIGVVTVESGSVVTSTIGTLGEENGSQGRVAVAGSGSAWRNDADLTVGGAGRGYLSVTDGGEVSAGNVYLGSAKTGVGSAQISGKNSRLDAGNELVVGALGSGLLSVVDSATVSSLEGFIAAGDGGTGTVSLTTGGRLSIGNGAGTLDMARGTGSVATLNIGGSKGSSAGAAGFLDASRIRIGAGSATINFNHTNTDYIFAAGIEGKGEINHLAGVTTLTGDSSGFTGTTNVAGGQLNVNGALGGDITVTNGVLGGSGTLSKVTVASGSTIRPGNSIGTLNTGDISFANGSNYTVELKAGGNTAGTHNDWINASGGATINGGSVFVTAENGTDTGTSYQDGTVYTILTAAGGRTGEFTGLSDDYAYIDFALSYDPNNVYLTSDVAVTDFCLNGYTANQCVTARGVQSLGSGTVYNAVLNLSTGEAPDAIGQLSGEVYASTNTALFEDSRFARETSIDRLRQAMSGVGSDGNATTEQKVSQDLALWGQGYGAWAHTDSDGNAYQMDRSTGGFLMGADALVVENVRAGVFAGYGSTQVDIPELASEASIDTLTLGTYAGAQWGGLALRGGLSYSWHGIDTTRDVSFTGFSDSLSAAYHARTAQAFGEVGYTVALGEARFEPFANLAYVNLHSDGVGEDGGAAALTLAEQSAEATFVTLGLRADSKFNVGDVTATLRGTLGYRHAYGDTPVALARFASGGDAFTVSGVPLARDSLVVEGGVEFGLAENVGLGLSYGGQFGSDRSDHMIRASYDVRF